MGGGGVAGIAWMTGLLAGLADAGKDVTKADLVVGTSAGSTVAAQLGSGLSLGDLYARQVDPSLQNKEIDPGVDMEAYGADLVAAIEAASSEVDARQRIGALALAARTVSEADRRAVVASRLPSHEWPSVPLKIVAVDAETGEPQVFGNDSGVSLVDAVAASCAVPGIWPTVSIDGRRYVDGGVRTMDNADLAAGFERVVILLPLGTQSLFPLGKPFDEVVADLRADVTVISPDEASAAAIGLNPLDPRTRAPAAEAGRAQGRAH
ncbi:patatin [Kibdelosporangium phytohabitans]|uniref:Patatin n=1 Tax=Kibdelosporangium phytohabitans TaxID=860235 RepID=A0A0N9IJP2_9PSEU|nr:patatin-like phospholipase family protein [Kibdelosporangium phytohabitans]ALG15266.1 patatin [Kibdelosporangium phytohabitans]